MSISMLYSICATYLTLSRATLSYLIRYGKDLMDWSGSVEKDKARNSDKPFLASQTHLECTDYIIYFVAGLKR